MATKKTGKQSKSSKKSLKKPSKSKSSPLKTLEALIQTVHTLRAPGGCPWDRAQTHQSLRPYLIEEAYEVLDVLDQVESSKHLRNKKIRSDLIEELGDLLMQVLIHAELARESKAFDIYEIAQALNDKLIRRHPHVFDKELKKKVRDAKSALSSWEKQKSIEKKVTRKNFFDGIPSALPALQRGARMIEKVSAVGFQWKDIQGSWDKVQEEIQELKEAMDQTPQDKSAIEAEFGDVLFTLCNLSYHLKVSPENALRTTLRKFESRFNYIEKNLLKNGKAPEQASLEEMDRLWNEAKAIEKKNPKAETSATL